MPDEVVEVVYVEGPTGVVRGFHKGCADWLELSANTDQRQPHHTEVCRGCGRFLLTPAPEHHSPKPAIDVNDLLT